jgi:pimeloyl-ACP methyl ester carboxylesterase
LKRQSSTLAKQVLNLERNELTGEIPPELSQLSSLEWLDLDSNDLTGEIPPELSQLSSLEWLTLSANQLTGEIPPELGQLSSLEYLWLDPNQLTGEIPPELGQLSSLWSLGLGYNQLTGEIPPELGQLSSLGRLWLGANQLTGAIPVSFTNLTSMSNSYYGLFKFNNTDLCEPPDSDFQDWFDSINTVESTGVTCSETEGPSITSVGPSPVTGSNAPQPFTISGSGFTSESTVTLRDKRTGEVFPDREISEQTSSSITINPTFTTEAATWTVEVSNPDGGSSGEYEFEVVSPTVARYPSLSLSTASLAEGESLTITGRDFTAGGSVSLRVTGPPGFETDQSTLTASSEGTFSTSFSPGSEAPAGKYAVSARDGEQDEATSSHTFRVEASPSEEPAFALEVTAPAEGEELQAGTQVQVRWTDRMTPGSSYPRENGGAIRGYRYDLEISDGGSWTSLGQVVGFKPIGETVNFRTSTKLPFTQSENARIRITDRYQTDRQAESGAFTVQQPPLSAENLEAELVWDYSFTPRPNSPPAGVAADGASRLYLVAQKKNADQGPPIERVDVSVATASGNTEKRLTGTLMPAEVTDRYSTEANGADARSVSSDRSRTGAGNEFWFWYVAPKDFKERERDLSRSTRTVDASFTVEYTDGTTVEDVEQQIEIARPPLMLVHGLAGSSSSWNDLTYREDRNGDGDAEETLLRNSKFFFEKEAVNISPDGSFVSNSELLLGDNSTNGFSDILNRMRRIHGYAANQVYYVGHSMGGAVARQLIGTGGTSRGGIPYHRRKNYDQGYVDRLITLDTPHAGSPFADFTRDDLIPSVTGLGIGIFSSALGWFDPFIRREGISYVVSDAVRDLAAGRTFPRTRVPSHLIVGDVTGKQNALDLLARPEAEGFVKAWKFILDTFLATKGDLIREALDPLLGESPEDIAFEMLEIFTGLGSDGDFVVPATSQLSGLGRDDPATSVFNVTHFDKLPRSVMERVEVGTRVFELLNEPVGGEQFTSSIPPSPDINVPDVQSQLGPEARASLQSNLSKSTGQTVDIEASVPKASVATDSTLTLRVNAPDTTGLRYLRVYFQNSTRLITEKDSTYELSLPVGGSAVDSQAVSVVASYRRPDTTALATDQAMVYIVPASPIQQLEVEPQVMSLREEQARRPNYEAVFEQSIAELGPGSENLTASVEDPSVVTFNADTKSFRGESGGETAATISYRGKTDVLYFTVSGKTDTTREEPSSGLQVAAGQTGTFELGTTGAEVTISENGDSDGGQLQFARREATVSTDAFEGSATAPDGSTISPNTASSRYWEITGEDLTDVSFEVRLDTAGIGGIDDPGRLLVLKREDSGSPWTPLNTTREGETLVSSTLGSFSEFAIGGNTSSNPLPVELSSLDAVVEEEQVTVTWTTASETGNARFQIQRKAERGRWTTVGSVEGAGTTSESRSYRFTDEDLPYAADRLTYRLRQVDTDGMTTLSDPVVVKQGVDKVELLATVPNPASRQARVRFSIPERQEVQLRLYDALGREVRAVVNAEREGRHEETIDVSGLPSGTYFIRLKAGSKTRTQRLTVVR